MKKDFPPTFKKITQEVTFAFLEYKHHIKAFSLEIIFPFSTFTIGSTSSLEIISHKPFYAIKTPSMSKISMQ
jgi:hypothetical protein